MKKKIVYIIILVIQTCFAKAQDLDIHFERLSIEQGLSHSVVYTIIQDDKGFMWFGTQDGGLNKYDGYKFTAYVNIPSDSTSISGNSVSALAKDKKGNLWIALWSGGLSYYNSKTNSFINFQNDPKNTNSLSSNTLQSVFVDSKGFVWIGTSDAGLNKFDPEKKIFKIYKNDKKNPNTIVHNRIWDIKEDKNGKIWLATSMGLDCLNPENDTFEHFMYNQKNEKGISFTQVRTILVDNKGRLWIGTARGIDLFDEKTKTFSHFKPYPNDTINSQRNNVNVITQDLNGAIWIGTQLGGLSKLLPNGKFLNLCNEEGNPRSLSYNDCRSIYQDRSGILWIGTRSGGLNKLNLIQKNISLYRRNPSDANSLSDNRIRGIAQDKNNQDLFWIATDIGGVSIYNRKTRTCNFLKKENHPNTLASNRIQTIYAGSKGIIWIGTNQDGLDKYDTNNKTFTHYKPKRNYFNSLSDGEVRAILEDKNGIIWIGTKEGLDRLDPKTETIKHYTTIPDNPKTISNNRVLSLCEDSQGNIWVGTNKGLNLLDKQKGTFKHYLSNYKDKKTIIDNQIFVISEDADGSIWIGTANGLSHLIKSGNNEYFENFNKEQGFKGTAIYGIQYDKNNNLWISTNNGIVKLNKQNKQIKIFDVSDGLQSNEFTMGASCKANDGEMYFGGNNGFNSFYPDSIVENNFVPEIAIIDFQIFNKSVLPGKKSRLKESIWETKEIELSYEDYVFSFEFAALHYVAPSENIYSYKMEGLNDEWIEFGNKHFVSFTTLPPGDYVFRVKGANNDNIWNEKGISIKIKISPPFWKTTWFIVTVILIIGFSIFAYNRIRVKILIRQKNILEEKVKQRTREITDQKNEIEKQRDLLTIQNKNITDSINYARKIQSSIFPPKEIISELFPNYFVLLKPKDIVSGDFYWVKQRNNLIYIAVADCTGHGVPGAFMSMLAASVINEIVDRNENNEKAHIILNELRERIIFLLHQSGKRNESRDGLDLSFCILNKEKRILNFAGAHNPIYIVRKSDDDNLYSCPLEKQKKNSKAFVHNHYEMYEYIADRMPISFLQKVTESFKNNEIDLQKDDRLYMFTDGYIDQFGGTKGNKLLAYTFKKIILEIQEKPIEEQRDFLDHFIIKWKGYREQVDDILILGIQID